MLFVLLIGSVQPAYASRYAFGEKEIFIVALPFETAQVTSATSKFEGLLNAYSVNHKQNIEQQLLASVDDLSTSLEQFNSALEETYPTLTEEEQLAVDEAYSSLRSYFEDLAVRTHSVSGREVFSIKEAGDVPEGIDSVQTFGLVLGPGL